MTGVIENDNKWKIDWLYIILSAVFIFCFIVSPSFITKILTLSLALFCLFNIFQIDD